MQIFGFDYLAYPKNLDTLKENGELPYPLPGRHFQSELAVSNYSEHLDGWQYMDEIGFDGIGFNEHHGSPFGMMNSPNVMAAAATQRTKNLKLLIYGNCLPIHEPLRLAEELAMLDCLSNGRLISGFVRGIPREYLAYGVNLAESRGRFEEAWDIVKRAWTEDVFSYEGKYWSYENVSIWPRPVQKPHPAIWMPVSVSKESIEWAAKGNIPITPGAINNTLPVRKDMVRYYSECLEKNGYSITPGHIAVGASVYVADSRQAAVKEAGPYMLYFVHTLFGHGNITIGSAANVRESGYRPEAAYDYIKPENLEGFFKASEGFRSITYEDLEHSERVCWGSPDEVINSLINLSDELGAGTLLLNFNQGAMPQELFMKNLERFGREVLPALKAHNVQAMPVAAD